MFCSQMFLLFPLVLYFVQFVSSACETDRQPNQFDCSMRNMTRASGELYQWAEWCEVFHGDLQLNLFDLRKADFFNLRKIKGRLSLINSPYYRMPHMPNLVTIETKGMSLGVVILNNKELRDMRGLVNWQKNVLITGSTKFPVFMSGNTELETVNLPKMYHNPYSPVACEKRLAPNYNIHFAEAMSLSSVLVCLIFSATIFLYPLSMGSANIYFVPGYHKL